MSGGLHEVRRPASSSRGLPTVRRNAGRVGMLAGRRFCEKQAKSAAAFRLSAPRSSMRLERAKRHAVLPKRLVPSIVAESRPVASRARSPRHGCNPFVIARHEWLRDGSNLTVSYVTCEIVRFESNRPPQDSPRVDHRYPGLQVESVWTTRPYQARRVGWPERSRLGGCRPESDFAKCHRSVAPFGGPFLSQESVSLARVHLARRGPTGSQGRATGGCPSRRER